VTEFPFDPNFDPHSGVKLQLNQSQHLASDFVMTKLHQVYFLYVDLRGTCQLDNLMVAFTQSETLHQVAIRVYSQTQAHNGEVRDTLICLKHFDEAEFSQVVTKAKK
jgi:hypothetical protein